MPKTINTNMLTEGAQFSVTGQIAFSRVSRQTTDAEREALNAKRKHRIETNYSSISLYNATVDPINGVPADAANATMEQKYALECLYMSSDPKNPGANFTAINKSKKGVLPKVGQRNAQGQYDEVKLNGRELARDINVTIVCRVFKGNGNNGVTLDAVLVNDPIKFYQSQTDASLAGLGIVFNSAAPEPREEVREEDGGSIPAPVQPIAQTAMSNEAQNPIPNVYPQQNFSQPVQTNFVQQAPQQMAPAQQNFVQPQQAQPVQQTFAQPQQGTPFGNFGGQPQQAQPAQNTFTTYQNNNAGQNLGAGSRLY